MTRDEFAGAIGHRVLARDHWKMLEVAPDVLRELFYRSVPTLRLFTHRFQNDVVQITFEFAAQSMGLGVSSLADRFRCHRHLSVSAGAWGRVSAQNRGAWFGRVLLADGLDDFHH